MSVKQVSVGEVLCFQPEETIILVVMVGDNGFRYIEPMNPRFYNNGAVESIYIEYDAISEWTISLGNITNISERLMGNKSDGLTKYSNYPTI